MSSIDSDKKLYMSLALLTVQFLMKSLEDRNVEAKILSGTRDQGYEKEDLSFPICLPLAEHHCIETM